MLGEETMTLSQHAGITAGLARLATVMAEVFMMLSAARAEPPYVPRIVQSRIGSLRGKS